MPGHWGAQVHPCLFQRIPPVKHEVGGQLLLREHLADDPLRLAGRISGSGVEQHVRFVRGDCDEVTKPTAHVVLQLTVAQGPNRTLGLACIVQSGGHPPVVCRLARPLAGLGLPHAQLSCTFPMEST